jgi:hypothetical protein
MLMSVEKLVARLVFGQLAGKLAIFFVKTNELDEFDRTGFIP